MTFNNVEAKKNIKENLLKNLLFLKLFGIAKYKRQTAFTLAEVLITLLIIGVVASIVIPSIMNDTKEVEYNIALKKIYGSLFQALKLNQVYNSENMRVGLGNSAADTAAFRDDFCNVMTCIKRDTGANIFNNITYKSYKAGDRGSLADNIDNSAILNDGSLLQFYSYGNCSGSLNICGEFDIDINGRKAPNMLGKDLYLLYVVRQNGNYSLLPAGVQGDTHKPASTTCIVGDGWGCASQRLYNPDQMP